MRIFVTGATGFIGSAVVRDLVAAGHQVTGLVRSTDAATSLQAQGAKACRGTIEDLEVLRRVAAEADGVVHTAFFHSLSHASPGVRLRILFGGLPGGIVKRFATLAVEADRRAIETLGTALRGDQRSLVIAFPTMALTQGRLAVETDLADPNAVGGLSGLRARCEEAALALSAHGVKGTIVRLPPSVHDETKQGLVTLLIEIARKKQVSAYVEDGKNRWGAVHRLDAARLFRLALEKGEAGARYHAVGEEAIAFRDIAEAIGAHMGVSTKALSTGDAAKHFGWLAPFVDADNPVSSQLTQQRLGWQPTHPALLVDIAGALRNAQAHASPALT